MRIGPYELGPGAALAPMAGITNPPFRMLCHELGAILSVTELVSCHALVYFAKKPRNRRSRLGHEVTSLLERYPGERPLAVQIFGRDPAIMAEAARIAEAEGADIIDLNFGCPARKVVKNGEGAGCALMLDPDLLTAIARAVVQAVKVPVTAKMRLGWSAEQKNGVAVARRLVDTGIAALCVHARVKDQIHSGPADLETLAGIVAAVAPLPVIGNGGVRDRASAEEMIARTGCARVAVGQASRGNPWIFSELRGGPGAPPLAGRVATCRRHLDLYVAFAGEELAALEMRKHACWYIKGFDGAAAFRKRLGEAVDAAAFNRLLDELPVCGEEHRP